MEMIPEEVGMMRLVKQATAQGLVMAQHYQSREIILFAPTGQVYRHPDVMLVRSWLRHYADCGRYGRRCFDQTGGFRCPCVPVLTPSYHGGFSPMRDTPQARVTCMESHSTKEMLLKVNMANHKGKRGS